MSHSVNNKIIKITPVDTADSVEYILSIRHEQTQTKEEAMEKTVSDLRLAERRIGMSISGMAETLGVHPAVYAHMRSYKHPLMAGDEIWNRIEQLEVLKDLREGR